MTVGTVFILLLQLWKLRHRKTIWFVQGHITYLWWNCCLNLWLRNSKARLATTMMLYLDADQAGCLINSCLTDWRKTMGSRKECPLDEPPKAAWKWGSWEGWSLFHQREQLHLYFTQPFQVLSAGASRLFWDSPQQLAPQSYCFPNSEDCFLETL